MLLSPQLLCLLGLMALGSVHASPSAELKLERGSCPMFWFSFNGRCYKYVPTQRSWNDAEKNCLSQDARLASIHSKEEHTFVMALIQNFGETNRYVWIGLNDLYVEHEWMWSDGSDVNYTNWYSGQPDGGEHCVVTNCDSGEHNWCDLRCSNVAPYVCVLRA